MNKPTIENTEAVFQAGTTIETYYNKALNLLDISTPEQAKEYQVLLAELVRSQTLDFNCTLTASALYNLVDALKDISEALEK